MFLSLRHESQPGFSYEIQLADAIDSSQILMHQSTWNQLLSRHAEQIENQDAIMFANMGKHQLKGISKMVYIIQAVPAALSSRSFPQIKTKTTKVNALGNMSISAGRMDIEKYLMECGGVKAPDTAPNQKSSGDTNAEATKYLNVPGKYNLTFLGMRQTVTRFSLNLARNDSNAGKIAPAENLVTSKSPRKLLEQERRDSGENHEESGVTFAKTAWGSMK